MHLIVALAGLAAAVSVTRRSHRNPSSPWWVEPVVKGLPLRRTDMPVVGSGVLAVAAVSALAGRRTLAGYLTALGAGASLGPVLTGLADPLR